MSGTLLERCLQAVARIERQAAVDRHYAAADKRDARRMVSLGKMCKLTEVGSAELRAKRRMMVAFGDGECWCNEDWWLR